jgi:hypothetical protein
MKIKVLLLVVFVSFAAVGLYASAKNSLFMVDLGIDWTAGWSEKKLGVKPTRYISIDENGRKVILGWSHDSASALYLPMRLPLSDDMNLSWCWKVTRALPENPMERQKSGDDYAARVLVSFSPDLFGKESRTLCYVWASTEAVGSFYESPYSKNVATIVVQSGTKRLGEWVMEKRNIVDDYRRAFGARPHAVFALAVIVDSDNTNSRATGWFSDVLLHP